MGDRRRGTSPIASAPLPSAVMQVLRKVARALSRAGAHVAVIILVLITGHILYEIVLRTFFARSTFVLDEMVGYGIAALTFLALGDALVSGGLIRVNLLLARLAPASLARQLVELACCLLTLAAMGIPLWFFGRSVIQDYRDGFTSGTLSNIKIWIPEAIVFAGLVVFWLQLLAYMLGVITRQENLDASQSFRLGGE